MIMPVEEDFSKCCSSMDGVRGSTMHNGGHNGTEMAESSNWYQAPHSLNRFSSYHQSSGGMSLQPFENVQAHRQSAAHDFNARKGSVSSNGSTGGQYRGEECGQAYSTFSSGGPFESGYGSWQQQQHLPSQSFQAESVHNSFDSSSSSDASPGSYHENTNNEQVPLAEQSFSQTQLTQNGNGFQASSTEIYPPVLYQYQEDNIAEPGFADGAFSDTNNNNNNNNNNNSVVSPNGNVYTCLQ